MIVGNIEEAEAGFVSYPEALKQALLFLQEKDFSQMSDGKYRVGKTQIFASVQRYRTRPATECRPEAHRRFVDVQYIAEGEESLGWCMISPDISPDVVYDTEKDVIFYHEMVPDSNIILSAGSFAILTPDDVHRPCGIADSAREVVKVVVKVPVDMLSAD